jgi:hypothetical protein
VDQEPFTPFPAKTAIPMSSCPNKHPLQTEFDLETQHRVRRQTASTCIAASGWISRKYVSILPPLSTRRTSVAFGDCDPQSLHRPRPGTDSCSKQERDAGWCRAVFKFWTIGKIQRRAVAACNKDADWRIRLDPAFPFRKDSGSP